MQRHQRLSAVADHALELDHTIHFNQTSILAKVDSAVPRVIKEAIEIKKHPNYFNRDNSFVLSHAWAPILKAITSFGVRKSQPNPIEEEPSSLDQPSQEILPAPEENNWAGRLRARKVFCFITIGKQNKHFLFIVSFQALKKRTTWSLETLAKFFQLPPRRNNPRNKKMSVTK